MINPDWLALVLSYVFVFAALGLAEGLRKRQGYAVDFTRKFVHVAVGSWAVGTVLLFQHWTFAVIPPLSFVLINYVSYRRETFKAMETGEKGNLGTVYFPLSFSLIVWLFWEKGLGWQGLLGASLMPMTWGDALAAILGEQFGQYQYKVLGSTRSLEGSLSMFLFILMATFLALLLLTPFGWLTSLLCALATAVVTTGVEAITPWHLDNLTVPLVSALLLYVIAPR